jgi:hypothetical protein
MIRDEIARRMIDGVAGRTPHTEELRLRFVPVADGTDVLVAVSVDLTRAHDDVAAARPHDVEYGAIGYEALRDDVGRHAHGGDVTHQGSDAVTEQEPRLEG